MTPNDHGLVGGIQATWLRRLALILVGAPILLIGMSPIYLRVIRLALREAVETFMSELEFGVRFPNALMSSGWKACWASSWKPE